MKSFVKIKMISIFLCFILSFLIVPQLSAQLSAQQDVPLEVIRAAQEGLPIILESISNKETKSTLLMPPPPPGYALPSRKTIYGFEESDPLDKAYLGDPFRYYMLTSDAVLNYSKDSNVDSLLSQKNQWYFPVMIGGNAKSVLIVDKMEESWKVVALGKKGLAKGLGKIQKQWSRAKGYTPFLLASYDTYKYLFTVPQYDSKNLTIISSKTETESKNYSILTNSEDVIEAFKTTIRNKQDLKK